MKTRETYVLRDYQQEASDIATRFFEGKNKPALMVLPTGSGKSLVIADIVKRIEGHTLIFQPSQEILKQNFEKFMSYDPYAEVSVFSASVGQKNISRVTYATIGSVINKKKMFNHFDNIIIDESHYVNPKQGMYKELLDYLKGRKVLGLTATPFRMNVDGYGGTMLKFLTRTRPRVFYDLVYHVQVKQLLDRGYLSKMRYYSVDGKFDTDRLEINSTNMDYTDSSLQHYYEEIDFKGQVVDYVNRLLEAGRKSVLVFTKFVDEAEHIKKSMPGVCEVVSGTTPKAERSQILEDFKSGKIKAVANVGVLTTGFDFPELDTVLLARTTRSLALYYQMVGRSIRPHKDKEEAWVVDMCGSFKMFGRVENLMIGREGRDKWFFYNTHRKLTNVYLD